MEAGKYSTEAAAARRYLEAQFDREYAEELRVRQGDSDREREMAALYDAALHDHEVWSGPAGFELARDQGDLSRLWPANSSVKDFEATATGIGEL